MGNVFDFELNADENATKALAEIEARIKQLNPLLGSTREALRFGGSETLETTGGLSNQLRDMSRYAQDIAASCLSLIYSEFYCFLFCIINFICCIYCNNIAV
ncbi:hypothetical protein ACP179_19805 [Xenorhabdus stockiae]